MRLVVPIGVVLLALLASGCGEESAPDVAPQTDLPDRVVVFAPDDLTGSELADEADWLPTSEDVVAAEELLDERLRSSAADVGLADLTDYVRQYAGVHGATIVVNALCQTDLDWQDGWITVNDGGACFWNATIDGSEITSFSVNGRV